MLAGRRMTDDEVMAHLRGDTPLNKARKAFSAASARIEQAAAQRSGLSPVDMRRMEFEAVAEIAAAIAAMPGFPDMDPAPVVPGKG